MPTAAPLVSVIVVSYNTARLTLDCLRSVYDHAGDVKIEILVVDNASNDGSADAIRTAFPEVTLIENERNTGFGAANNTAMAATKGRYFLLLNSDAYLAANALAGMVACLDHHPDAAVVGPRLLNSDGSLQPSCFRFPSPGRAWLENLWLSAALPNHPQIGDYRRWAHDAERAVDFVIGACMLVRRAAYEQVGGFDERFFMYGEESEWQRRFAEAGWKTVFTPEARVVHLGGGSGHGSKVVMNPHFFQSLDEYQRIHHGLAGLISLRCAMAIGCLLRTFLWTLASLRPQSRPLARDKARLHSQLFLRQTLHWN